MCQMEKVVMDGRFLIQCLVELKSNEGSLQAALYLKLSRTIIMFPNFFYKVLRFCVPPPVASFTDNL